MTFRVTATQAVAALRSRLPGRVWAMVLGAAVVFAASVLPMVTPALATGLGVIARAGALVLGFAVLRGASTNPARSAALLGVLAALHLLTTTGMVLADTDRDVVPLVGAVAFAAAGSYVGRSGFSSVVVPATFLSFVSWAWGITPDPSPVIVAATAAPTVALLLLASARGTHRPRKAALAGAVALSGLVAVTQGFLYTTTRGAAIDATVLVAAVLAVLLAATGSFAVVFAGKHGRRAAVASVAIAAFVFGFALDATRHSASIEQDPQPLVAASGAKMLSEEGAGPREEFRGWTFEQCDRVNVRDCYITVYDDLANREGVRAAVADLLEKVRTNQGATFAQHCHQVAHNLGQMAFQLTSDFQTVAAIDPQVCGTGYTHGVWELVFSKFPDRVLFTRTGEMCKNLNMVTDWYRWSCNHILGHMVMTKMMTNPTRAMESCSTVPLVNRSDCLVGGWMNYFQDDYLLEAMGERGTMQDVFNVCYGAPAGRNKMWCYQEMFPTLYRVAGGDDYAVAKGCIDHSEPTVGQGPPYMLQNYNYRERCFWGLARGIAASSQYDYRLVIPRCLSLPVQGRDSCLTAAANSVVLNTGATKAGVEVCTNVVDTDFRAYCYTSAKMANQLLADGPNAQNLPDFGELRLPGELKQ